MTYIFDGIESFESLIGRVTADSALRLNYAPHYIQFNCGVTVFELGKISQAVINGLNLQFNSNMAPNEISVDTETM